jgi:hypothetical protein
MDKFELDRKLNNGEQWGFVKETDSVDYLGWILINKRPKMRFEPQKSDYDDETYLLYLDKYQQREKTPYHLLVYELRRDVHERGDYETGDDVRQKDNYYFSSVDQLETFVRELGYSFENIKHRSEIDAP